MVGIFYGKLFVLKGRQYQKHNPVKELVMKAVHPTTRQKVNVTTMMNVPTTRTGTCVGTPVPTNIGHVSAAMSRLDMPIPSTSAVYHPVNIVSVEMGRLNAPMAP